MHDNSNSLIIDREKCIINVYKIKNDSIANFKLYSVNLNRRRPS